MKTHGRKDTLIKAIKLIALLENGPVTVITIKEELELNISNAYRWLRNASVVLPIYECGSVETGKRGRPMTLYALLGKERSMRINAKVVSSGKKLGRISALQGSQSAVD